MAKKQYDEKEHEKDLTLARDTRCVPVAMEIITMIASYKDGILGSTASPEKVQASYNDLSKDILKLILERNVLLSDINFIGQLINSAFENSMGVVNRSINISLKEMEKKILGKEIRDLSVGELDTLLKLDKSVL